MGDAADDLQQKQANNQEDQDGADGPVNAGALCQGICGTVLEQVLGNSVIDGAENNRADEGGGTPGDREKTVEFGGLFKGGQLADHGTADGLHAGKGETSHATNYVEGNGGSKECLRIDEQYANDGHDEN